MYLEPSLFPLENLKHYGIHIMQTTVLKVHWVEFLLLFDCMYEVHKKPIHSCMRQIL